jgi:AraC-like DNA-binding protein
LLDSARRELAHHYYGQSSVELNETTYLLGYEDPNSLVRAFHEWEGTSPGSVAKQSSCPYRLAGHD